MMNGGGEWRDIMVLYMYINVCECVCVRERERERGVRSIVVNKLNCDIVVSSNSSRAITFSFGLIPLVLNNTSTVLLQGQRWR